jgi:hypothetical protein
MTSSQEPPLTRREARERERLLQAQREAQADADAAPATAPAPPTSAPPPAPVPTPGPAPAPPAQSLPTPPYSAPQPAAAPPPGQAPAFGGTFSQQSPQSWPQPPAQSTTPERTLTRRELRAMLEGHSDEFDDFDDEPVLPAPAPSFPAPAPVNPPAAASGPVPPTYPPAAPFPPQQAPTREPAPHQVAESAVADEPMAAPKPVGHWTAQLNAPVERAEPFDQLLSRGAVSHGIPTTTNALILPTLPDQGHIGGGIESSEVIVTGSIDLPRSYGATGVHPSQIDSSDVDRLFDQIEDGAGIGSPVAATRAVSTQGGAKAMMAPPKKEGVNVPLVLALTAGVLALGVVATLVIGAVSGLF